jgi:cytochrome c553
MINVDPGQRTDERGNTTKTVLDELTQENIFDVAAHLQALPNQMAR